LNTGKTLFTQLMEFVPWTSFSRIVARYAGDSRAMVLPCSEHFRVMAYAQLTWRESLRDIEATLGANPTKLYGMGLRQAVRRSTLADANERRDWRTWSDLATVLIRRARKLYAQEDLGLDVNIAGNVYALDSSTIDLCLSLMALP
jgi:cobalamin biosynthesis Mg chelatase CobN